MDADRVPAGDPLFSPTGSGPAMAAGALGAAGAAMRMAGRRHPVVPAAILSDLVVRAVEIAAAVNRGRHGNPDRPLIRALARDLGCDLNRARDYAQARHLRAGIPVTRGLGPLLRLDQARDLRVALIRALNAALRLARELARAIDDTLARHLNLRLSFSHEHDLELACELADKLDSDLERATDLAVDLYELSRTRGPVSRVREQILTIDRSLSRTLDLAGERSGALDRVCAQGAASRLGISSPEGLAQELLGGAIDDFTSADLTYASLADADLTAVRWSLTGTKWPPGTDVKTLLARSERVEPGSGVLVVTRRGVMRPLNLNG
jgi:hypothetical protein